MKPFQIHPDDLVRPGGIRGRRPKHRWAPLWNLAPWQAVEAWGSGTPSAHSVALTLAKKAGHAPPYIKSGRLKDGRVVYYNPGESKETSAP